MRPKIGFRKLYFLFFRFGFITTTKFTAHFYILYFLIYKKFSGQFEFSLEKAVKSPEKYLNISYWVFENLIRAFDLNLHRQQGLKILDLGCGPGYFVYIANYFKHDAEGLDIGSNDLYNQMIASLSLTRYEQAIMPFKPLSLPSRKKYDLISAFMICFDGHGTDEMWGTDKWNFFIQDIENNHLQEEGKIFLGLNPDHNSENRASINFLLKKYLYY